MITSSREQAVLRFWRACEMFSPQPIPKVDRKRPSPVEQLSASSPLPWDSEHRPAFARSTRSPRAGGARVGKPVAYEWRHTVYLRVFPLTELYQALERVFPFDQESFDPRPGGESALAAFAVDQDGFLIEDSPVLSACGWAAGIVGRNGGSVKQLDGLDEAQKTWLRRVNDIVAEESGDPDRSTPLNATAVRALAAMTTEFTRFPHLSGAGSIRVLSKEIRADGAQNVQADFLNSFFLDDLSVVAAAAGTSAVSRAVSGRPTGLGRALSRYLTERSEVDLDERIDTQLDLTAVGAATGPNQMPDGRWPSKPSHPLALSQQLAVNLISQDAGNGLFAVNGPPGTGKTTLLRDIFAARLVERAHRLAALEKPEDGFKPPLPPWTSDTHPRTVHPVIEPLTGFEMVLASSNNAAVNNVSDEIPSAAKIDDGYRDRIDYFTAIATAILQPAPPAREVADQEDDEDSSGADASDEPKIGWALTAAKLGNKKNRASFVSRFWFGDRTSKVTYEAMQPLLHRWKGEPHDPLAWAEAVGAFRAAVEAEQTAVAVRHQVAAALEELERSTTALAEARGRWVRAAEDARSLGEETARLDAERVAAQSQVSTLVELEVSRRPPRPGLLLNVVTFGIAGRRWAARGTLKPEEVEQRRIATAQRNEAVQAHEAVGERYRWIASEMDELRQAIERQQAIQDDATRVIDDAPSIWGDALPSPAWWHRDVERREKVAPWLDGELNDLRVTVLFAAMSLHRAFVRGNAATFETSLRAAMDVVTGVAPAEVPPATRLAAWQVLFLVVPLVSTTFASFGRMFGGLHREELGWLLIDEAGQSAPQVAVGAMWRARNVVVVGDPRQLRPVVTITPRLEGALAKAYGVDDKWRPLSTSVQAVADEVNRWGTWLAPTADEPRLWIGAPLRVHRRCDQPMLDICNEIAYPVSGPNGPTSERAGTGRRHGLMIDGVTPRDDVPLPPSQWYHRRAASSIGHFVPAELALVRELLDQVLQTGVPLREVVCISPFKDTADRLVALADSYGATFRGGTIHTAQGQEADVVFLVLGGDPNRPGAKGWASSTPNLVNVAVSRAKRRLYVIGDKTTWSGYRFFDVLSASLDDHATQTSVTEISSGA